MKIENVKIYTMDPALGVIPCGFIEFDAGKITAVGACEGDGSGGILFPGFIDGHTHLGLSEDSLTFEGDDLNEGTDPITPQLRAIDAINPLDRTFTEAREAGITCVAAAPGSANPIGGQIAVLKTAGKRVDDMIIAAPAAMKFALGENPKGVYHEKNQTPETRMATAALMREQLFKAKKYAEALDKYEKQRQEYLDNPDENDEPSEPEFDFKSEALLPVIRREIPVHFHAHRADDIFTAIRIAKEFHLRYTIVHCTDGHLIADELAKENASAFAGPNLCDRSKPELKNQTFRNPRALAEAGVMVGITTDHPVIPLQYLPLCMSLAVKNGMKEMDALSAVTISPARILGIDHRVGSLTPGKDADMVLFNGSPFDIMSEIRQVWINGQPIKS